MHWITLGLMAGLLALPGAADCQVVATRQPSVTLPAELDRVLRDYESRWANGDAAGLAMLFTDDGFVSGDSGWIRGREQIRAKYASAGGDLRLRALAYETDGSVGYIVGAYGYGAAAAETDIGKFILTLRSQADGAWLIAVDLDKGNRPPQPGAN